MSDPLSEVHKGLVTDLLAHPVVSRYFRNNFEDSMTARGTKTPDTKSESNLPWLAIIPNGAEANLNNASEDAYIMLEFRIQIITGDRRFSELYPAVFGLFAALVDIERNGSDTLRAITWQGIRVVTDIHCSRIDLARFSATENVEAITGTTSVATVTVDCHFRRSDLATYSQI